MRADIKPFRQVVAEHYFETKEAFTSKDVARDFNLQQCKANATFKGIWSSGKYRIQKVHSNIPYKMRIIGIDDTRGKKTYTDSSKVKRETASKQHNERCNDEISRLMQQFCGLRG